MANITKHWMYGRTAYSFKQEKKNSKKQFKHLLNRKIRHSRNLINGCFYKKYAKDKEYIYVS